MTSNDEFYKCEVCGNLVRMVEVGAGTLVCCGKDMVRLDENTAQGNEKHVPVISVDGNEVKVSVGSVPHPMEDEHWIEFIELFSDGKLIASKHLYPKDRPVAIWTLDDTSNLSAKALCNVHGLWKS